jgi:hypothetical protein
MDRLIRQLNRSRQTHRAWGYAFEAGSADGRGAVVLNEVVEDRIDSDLAGLFSGLLSAHAVADDEDSVTQVVSEIVLVVLAHESDVGAAGGLEDETHREECER